jgi:hypothetical protein
MTKPDLTAIALIVDRSGSMESIRSDAQGSIDAFIRDQDALPGQVLWTVVLFDSEYDQVAFMEPTAPKPRLEPRGSTALFDAVGRTINGMGVALAAMAEDERPSKVIVVIVTDGHENSSREYAWPVVKEMVQRQTTEWSWEFVFLAAGLGRDETIAMGASMGIPRQHTMTASRSAYGGAVGQTVNSYVTDIRQGKDAHLPDAVEE